MTPAEERGLKIRRARERLGWTQRELASYVGASHKSVGNWERGTTSPKNRTGALEAVLGISLNGNGNGPGAEIYTDPLEEAIWAETTLPPQVRREIIAHVRQARTRPAARTERPPA
jgi:transcriptional regulator with XRE-family HTH domain